VPAVIVRGVSRAVLGAAAPGTGAALWIHVEPVDEPEPTERARELAREYRGVVETILEKRAGARLAEVFSGITDPGAIADTAGYWPELSVERKIEVLETLDVEARLEKVLAWARDALADLTVKEEIQHNVAEGMDKAQRQFVLRQQLAAIQKELGEDGDGDAASEFRAKVAELELPDAVRAAVEKEIDRLERMSDQSPEQGWIPSPSCRGARRPPTTSTSTRRASCSTPTTPAWRT
jgi:ATP-dependent Lon protease